MEDYFFNCFIFCSKPEHSYEFHAIDFNYHGAEVIFSDVYAKVPTIRRANMNDKADNNVIIYGPGRVEGKSFIVKLG